MGEMASKMPARGLSVERKGRRSRSCQGGLKNPKRLRWIRTSTPVSRYTALGFHGARCYGQYALEPVDLRGSKTDLNKAAQILGSQLKERIDIDRHFLIIAGGTTCLLGR